jgi:hypothetical protein
MDEQKIVEKINLMLEHSGYTMEIADLSDIENFLSEEENADLEVYEEIENLYSQLMEDKDFE